MGLLLLIAICAVIFWLLSGDSDLRNRFYQQFGKKIDSLRGKTVLITGASSGIGEQLAYQLATVGCKLILSARLIEQLQEVRRKCLQLNQNLSENDVMVLQMDMADTDSHEEKFKSVLQQFGSVNVLINNAGRGHEGCFERCALDTERKTFDVNFFGLISITRLVVSEWIKTSTKGHIVVVSSMAAIYSPPYSATYTATKHALHGYFTSVAGEMASEGITVSLACPGPVDTRIFENMVVDDGHKAQKFKSCLMMSAERCAYLTLVAACNCQAQTWICSQPLLAMFYVYHYGPFSDWLLNVIGLKKMMYEIVLCDVQS